MKLTNLFASMALVLAAHGSALAATQDTPFGSIVFNAPTGIVGPNDVIDGWMTFTLDINSIAIDVTQPYAGGNAPTDWLSVDRFYVNVGFGCSDTFSGGCNSNGTPYKFSFDDSADGYSKIQNDTLKMNPGESISFNAFRFTPNPSPVPAGIYGASYYSISGNFQGRRLEQQFDENSQPILDVDGNAIYIEVDAYQSFQIAESCLDCNVVGLDPTTALFSRTVTAVPEPESYAMLIAGLALIGSVARSTKRKSQ